ncbi:FecR family protein [Peristeroidobacter soli]|uniref:FecR family protein n=1 Tax=Peristeroidobacter soli TaxID=2497877 RepID=UPI00101BE6DB|nr:FecR domain-containing protein [Peristeroidobacter soli]
MKSGTDVDDQAARWLVCRDRMEECATTRRDFEAWLAADARHRTAYLALERAWRSADGLKSWRPGDASVDPGVLRSRTSGVRGSTIRFAAAAMLLVTIGLITWHLLATDTYTTDVGDFRRVLLADGSVLQLNTDSKVSVRFTDARREVRLLHGEAHFTVAHDKQRPFDVIASGTVVRAVGTAFTVRIRQPDDVEVLVTEGTVSLGSQRPEPIAAMHLAHAKRAGVKVERVAQPEVSRLLAWQVGDLVFDDLRLGDAVAEFNRYNNRQLQIADPELASLRIGGNFRATDPDGFVRALRASFAIEAQHSDSLIVLSKRREQ